MAKSKSSWLLVGSVVLLVLILGVTAVFAQTDDNPISPEEESSTEEQQTFPSFRHNFRGMGFGGRMGGLLEGITPHGQLLADALDITLEELQQAQSEAHTAWLAEMVDQGYMTQEQADLMNAMQAFRGTIDRDELTAAALGITVEDLAEARDAGKSLGDLLDEQGLTAEEFSDALQAQYQAALDQAVADGILTQEQADQLQEGCLNMPGSGGFHNFEGMGGFRGPHGGRGFGGHGGMMGFGSSNSSITPEQATSNTF